LFVPVHGSFFPTLDSLGSGLGASTVEQFGSNGLAYSPGRFPHGNGGEKSSAQRRRICRQQEASRDRTMPLPKVASEDGLDRTVRHAVLAHRTFDMTRCDAAHQLVKRVGTYDEP